MDDLQIIELYFARDEHAIKETDRKYGKLCFRVAKNLLFNNESYGKKSIVKSDKV